MNVHGFTDGILTLEEEGGGALGNERHCVPLHLTELEDHEVESQGGNSVLRLNPRVARREIATREDPRVREINEIYVGEAPFGVERTISSYSASKGGETTTVAFMRGENNLWRLEKTKRYGMKATNTTVEYEDLERASEPGWAEEFLSRPAVTPPESEYDGMELCLEIPLGTAARIQNILERDGQQEGSYDLVEQPKLTMSKD